MSAPDRIAFGDFVLDRLQRRVVRRDGSIVSLTPRLFDALALFIEHSGQLLDKDFLMARLWPGLVVEENNLSQVVFGLRRALGDDGNTFIQTVPRRGFRFVARVYPLPASEDSATVVPAQRMRVYMLGGTALAAIGVTSWQWWPWRRAGPAGRVTLAVLPFKALSASADDELLGVGMADSLVERLSLLAGVVVRSTGSVLRYGAASRDAQRAARELDVEWIVDGSIQRHGDRVRATARLVRASDESSAWSGSFDEKFVDVFDVQDQMANRLAQELAPTLRLERGATPEPLQERGGTRNLEAYQLYLTAAWRAQGGNLAAIERAIGLLKRALELDPGFAIAWTQLAWSQRRKLWNADAPPAEVFRDSNAALDRALALVPNLAQARAGRGFTYFWHDFDWAAAEQEFRAALATNPSEVSAHHGLGMLLVMQGRLAEGLAHVRLARELDPMSPVLNATEAGYLAQHGQLEQARARVERSLDIAPQLWLGHVAHGLLLSAQKQQGESIASFRRAAELAHETTRAKAMLGAHLAMAGQRDEAALILAELVAAAAKRYVPPTSVAAIQAALGQADAAIASLDQAIAARDIRVIFMKDDPLWAGLRGHARFSGLVARLGMDRYGPGLSTI